MNSIRVVAALLLGLALSTPVFAQSSVELPVAGAAQGSVRFGDGVAAFSAGDFSTALRVWRTLAEQGNPKAQTGVGVIYYTGRGVPPDYGEAVKWFKLAAGQGDADALYNLGVMFAYGFGVEPDRATSEQYYRFAANQGHKEALKALRETAGFAPTRTITGQAVRRISRDQRRFESGLLAFNREDYGTALRAWRPLARKGHARAQNNLGVMYHQGIGVPQDNKEALRWIRRSAERDYFSGQSNLGVLYLRGDGVAQDFGEARKWLQRAAAQGYVDAEYLLAGMFQDGQGFKRDARTAAAWYTRASNKGHTISQFNLGTMLENGVGVEKDPAQAAQWYRRAANKGMASAQYNLGRMYARGVGVRQSEQLAASWYRQAAEKGFGPAQTELALRYEQAMGLPRDLEKAASWYRNAAAQGEAVAQYNLGALYARGDGALPDYAAAAELFRQAADKGLPQAQHNLARMYDAGIGVEQDSAKAGQLYDLASAQGYAGEPDVIDTASLDAPEPEPAAEAPPSRTSPQLRVRLAGELDLPPELQNLRDLLPEPANFQAGVSAYRSGDFDMALAQFSALAEDGDPNARYNLGIMYARGHGVDQDVTEATNWFIRTVEEESRDFDGYDLTLIEKTSPTVSDGVTGEIAFFKRLLGRSGPSAEYQAGVKAFRVQDYATARALLEPLAQDGDPGAQGVLAFMYELGLGVTANRETARDFYRQAAANGDPSSQFNLGLQLAAGNAARDSFNRVHLEDIPACEGIQAGIQSRIWSPGPLSIQEATLHHFHQQLANAVTA